jgi:hypothetical protein
MATAACGLGILSSIRETQAFAAICTRYQGIAAAYLKMMRATTRSDTRVQLLARVGILGAAGLLSIVAPARAVEPSPQGAQSAPPTTSTPSPSTAPEPTATDKSAPDQDEPAVPSADSASDSKNRIFGVVPNYTTVEGFGKVKPITTAQSFKMAALDAFDPFVYPLFAFIAGTAQAQHEPQSWEQDWSGYGKRYGLAFADNTTCSLITTGLMPSLLKQDPRYYQGRKTGFFPRLGYAASRSVVTKSRSGHSQFNLSEIGGTFVVAGMSNLYYPQDERNMTATLERWGTQAMWDTVANELKEFWPDIRKMMGGH